MITPSPGSDAFRYFIEVEGVVDPRWSEWFDDVEVGILPSPSHPRRTTLVVGLTDQAALPAVLARVTGLNLKVVSVTPAPQATDEATARHPLGARMTRESPSTPGLTRKAVRIGVAAFLVLGAMFFIPAGTLAYWQAWLYMSILLIPMVFVVRYLARNSPELLERRFRIREKERTQRGMQAIGTIFLLAAFVIPGLDQRWGWSSVPVWCVIAADLLVLLGYFLVVRVFMENEYASRSVEVVEGQRVISSGPYAIVRHPMYVGVIVLYLASPVALGSWWALLPAALIVPMLVVRIVNEEQVLDRDLSGYREYKQKTRYRLFPGIW